jgi:alpha-tubulin suppressor-like RCC1 family protein
MIPSILGGTRIATVRFSAWVTAWANVTWTLGLATLAIASMAYMGCGSGVASGPMPTIEELGTEATSGPVVPRASTPLAVGGDHACALTSAGGATCWGRNVEGELGNGSTTDSSVPVPVNGLGSGVASISAGYWTSCAVTSAGAALCWGLNGDGALGNNSTVSSSVPVGVWGLGSGVAAISVGLDYACAVTSAGAARCWGANNEGELGNGSTTGSLAPVGVSTLSAGVVAISAGNDHTCALLSGGGVQCWGDNPWGQLGNGTTTRSTVPVAVSGLTG